MELTLIIVLFSLGFLFLFIELFFIPGSTVVGILGIIMTGIGVTRVYQVYDTSTGNWVLFAALFLFIGSIIIAAKSGAWDRFSNKGVISGRVQPMITPDEVKAGDSGYAVSAIRPIGKARINDKDYEVRSMGEFINSGTKLSVTKVSSGRIFVRKIEEEQATAEK